MHGRPGFADVLQRVAAGVERAARAGARAGRSRCSRARRAHGAADERCAAAIAAALPRGRVRRAAAARFDDTGTAASAARPSSRTARPDVPAAPGHAATGDAGGAAMAAVPRSTRCARAASTTSSAAASIATRPTSAGSIPHFEKMLYDNALLVPAYLEAPAAHAADAALRATSRARCCDYVLREMTAPRGRLPLSRRTPTARARRAVLRLDARDERRGAARRRERASWRARAGT